jgi:hypothetical protein
MKEIKNLCLRLREEAYTAFDLVCQEKGYSKTGKIRELIRPPQEGQINGSTLYTLRIIPPQPNPGPAFGSRISRVIFNKGG